MRYFFLRFWFCFEPLNRSLHQRSRKWCSVQTLTNRMASTLTSINTALISYNLLSLKTWTLQANLLQLGNGFLVQRRAGDNSRTQVPGEKVSSIPLCCGQSRTTLIQPAFTFLLLGFAPRMNPWKKERWFESFHSIGWKRDWPPVQGGLSPGKKILRSIDRRGVVIKRVNKVPSLK